MIEDQGLTVESSIGFSEWIVDDASRRKRGLEDAKRGMDLVRQIGGKHLGGAAAGTTNESLDLLKVAERYRKLLDLGDRFEVVPKVELWGFSKTLTRLGDAMLVAVQSDHPRTCLLPDVYHLYKGGSGFEGLRLLGPEAYHVIHMNDYPARPPRPPRSQTRGAASTRATALLRSSTSCPSSRGRLPRCASLELFNRDYWDQDPLLVAQTGLQKMKAVVKASI